MALAKNFILSSEGVTRWCSVLWFCPGVLVVVRSWGWAFIGADLLSMLVKIWTLTKSPLVFGFNLFVVDHVRFQASIVLVYNFEEFLLASSIVNSGSGFARGLRFGSFGMSNVRIDPS